MKDFAAASASAMARWQGVASTPRRLTRCSSLMRRPCVKTVSAIFMVQYLRLKGNGSPNRANSAFRKRQSKSALWATNWPPSPR
ncbi:hypothetical protein D3C72_2412880 [compost metagenome]